MFRIPPVYFNMISQSNSYYFPTANQVKGQQLDHITRDSRKSVTVQFMAMHADTSKVKRAGQQKISKGFPIKTLISFKERERKKKERLAQVITAQRSL